MKKTISLLALATLFSTYCLAYDNKVTEPQETEIPTTEELLIHAIDCSDWINAIPEEIDPAHFDPAHQLDLRPDNMDWTDENFHFNYLLHPTSGEA